VNSRKISGDDARTTSLRLLLIGFPSFSIPLALFSSDDIERSKSVASSNGGGKKNKPEDVGSEEISSGEEEEKVEVKETRKERNGGDTDAVHTSKGAGTTAPVNRGEFVLPKVHDADKLIRSLSRSLALACTHTT
jgi:hypothetical protein